MRLRVRALLAAGVLAAAGCAPAPGGTVVEPEASPSETAAETAAPSEEPSAEPTEAEPAPSESVTEEPTVEPEASAEPSETAEGTGTAAPAEPIGDGWTALDAKLTDAGQVAALGLPQESEEYLVSRLMEPCDLQITLYAAHSDGYLVADESGICDGQALFVYGPEGSQVRELVEFSSVQECSAFADVGVPKGVPTSQLFPDGLACTDGGKVEQY